MPLVYAHNDVRLHTTNAVLQHTPTRNAPVVDASPDQSSNSSLNTVQDALVAIREGGFAIVVVSCNLLMRFGGRDATVV